MATAVSIGTPINRVDGRLKVSGEAKYAGEFHTSNLTYGVVVSSTISRGTIISIDTKAALDVPGVLFVFTHENRPKLPWFDRSYRDEDAPAGSPFRPLYDNKIVYSGQPIALVVAESFEVARYASSLIRTEYKRQSHQTDFKTAQSEARAPKKGKGGYEPPPKPWGDPDKAFAEAPVKVSTEYICPTEHHNPMEMHASTVIWEGEGKITVYDKTQGVQNSQKYISNVFDMSTDDVHVLSPFVGGAFGSGLRPQYQLLLAVMAASELKRSVRVTLTRQQMFTFGHRPETHHHVSLASDKSGMLQAMIHEGCSETSRFEDYVENVVNWGGMLYKCDNVRQDHKVVELDFYTPLDMRAPGAAWGVNALESAMDELSYQVGIDPLELRIKNYSEKDQNKNKPYSSKELHACYREGAKRFGWEKRSPQPRSMREGKQLVGWGMATGVWDAMQQKASARATLTADGRLTVESATADIGTGTYTVMTQIAADTLGLPLEDVTFKLGDSSLPTAPLEGGSWTVSSVGSAVAAACEKIREQVLKLAKKVDGSPLAHSGSGDVKFAGGRIHLMKDLSQSLSIAEVLRHSGTPVLQEETSASPNFVKQAFYTRCTHSAVFVEVKVDEDLGTIKVTRVVSAIAAGRIISPKTARSQIIGGVVWGIGMGLEEETAIDQQFGRYMNHNLAEYHVPVNADVPEIDVLFVKEEDTVVNPLGAKGVGEIGIVGVAAAIGNAVYHATGVRVRELPITLDKVLSVS